MKQVITLVREKHTITVRHELAIITGMCGRFSLTTTNDELMQRFGVVVTQNLRPRWNIAPSQHSLVLSAEGLTMRDEMAQFGVYSARLKKRIMNARCETISDKQLFADAFGSRRCLVPASGWYEWDSAKQPHHIQLLDGRVMGFAGIMFGSQQAGDASFVILTTESDGVLSSVHHRCPLVLPATQWQIWLNGNEAQAKTCLVPPSSRFFNLYPVSRAVGSVKNDTANLAAPLSEGERAAELALLKTGDAKPKQPTEQTDLFG